MRALLAFIVPALLSVTGVQAAEKPVALKDAPGRQTVEENCASCHSLDYPRTNSPFMDHKTWEAEVHKMVAVFGAPISPEDAKIIVEYLVKNYGTGG